MLEPQDAYWACVKEHLPYELDTLHQAFDLVNAISSEPFPSDEKKAIRNMAMESFWVHARALMYFFRRRPNTMAQGEVSARDFTTSGYQPRLDQEIDTLQKPMEEQVAHLKYERAPLKVKLNTGDMERVLQAIDREVVRFENALLPEVENSWKQRSEPTRLTVWANDVQASTNHITVVSTTSVGPLNIFGVYELKK